MKIELRWLEVVTGRKRNYEKATWEPTYTPKLQYRERYDANTATQWQDVPTEREEE